LATFIESWCRFAAADWYATAFSPDHCERPFESLGHTAESATHAIPITTSNVKVARRRNIGASSLLAGIDDHLLVANIYQGSQHEGIYVVEKKRHVTIEKRRIHTIEVVTTRSRGNISG
jgi:hypothetical protein